ncbi:hypothetical protein EIN_186420 [Entamoeba invadens IP1]|uniref:hypothetical protein n=1 Tax=Entamoeba invadens IP1 TaxID=370355 RepID=UPI0002C3DE63|nr:hypothetical protein EIN_186420 [Entamoeba invadens IP1]ELP94215.1 hypothetical protein EIN_186420 [Entamoeba invadens IP1]|eukprot:XP_004260986.1 hypothetical protein EIN_186420 [Entamoeba invadens IP1]
MATKQFDELESLLNNFSKRLNDIDKTLQSVTSNQQNSEDLLKKTRALRETALKNHQDLLNFLNSHQQSIERQISDIRVAMGCGKNGERSNPLDETDIQHIESLTGLTTGDVKYQATVDGFINSSFNKCVSGVPNLIVVVFDSEGNVFGSFNSEPLPNMALYDGNSAKGVFNDPKHFFFVLKRKGVSDVKKYTRKSVGYSMWLFSAIENLVSVNGAFVLVNNCNRSFDSSISGNFNREYGEPLTVEKKKFMVRDVVAFSLK